MKALILVLTLSSISLIASAEFHGRTEDCLNSGRGNNKSHSINQSLEEESLSIKDAVNGGTTEKI